MNFLETISAQDGLITAKQCRELQIKPERGWRAVFRGVYLTDNVEPTRIQLIRAALLTAGPSSAAVLTSAATLHGWPVVPRDDNVQVSLPAAERRVDQRGLVTRQLVLHHNDITVVEGMRVTSPIRTAADLLLRLQAVDGLAMLDAAMHSKQITTEDLEAVPALIYGNKGAVTARRVLELADGRAESPLESRVRLICVEGGVAPEAIQYPIRDGLGNLLAVSDFAWQSRMVLGEADGRAVHSAPSALLNDRWRQNELTARGYNIIRFTWEDTLKPYYIVSMVRRALAASRP